METTYYPIRHISSVTGVKSITLRAWERRYQLLSPKRTKKGHRLYTDEDITLIQRVTTLLNHGYAIREVPELLKNYDHHMLVTDKRVNELVCFQKLAKLIKANKTKAAIQEIENLMSLYSPESYAQLIYPEMMKYLNHQVFISIDYAEVLKEQLLDAIIWRLQRNISKAVQPVSGKVYIVGYRTAMIKALVIHGLLIANIFSSHGFSVEFCSGVASIDAIRQLPTAVPKLIFIKNDDFHLQQLQVKLNDISDHLFVSVYRARPALEQLAVLPSNYIECFEAYVNRQGQLCDPLPV